MDARFIRYPAEPKKAFPIRFELQFSGMMLPPVLGEAKAWAAQQFGAERDPSDPWRWQSHGASIWFRDDTDAAQFTARWGSLNAA